MGVGETRVCASDARAYPAHSLRLCAPLSLGERGRGELLRGRGRVGESKPASVGFTDAVFWVPGSWGRPLGIAPTFVYLGLLPGAGASSGDH